MHRIFSPSTVKERLILNIYQSKLKQFEYGNPNLHNYESKSLFYILIAIVTTLNNKRVTCNQIADPTCILCMHGASALV